MTSLSVGRGSKSISSVKYLGGGQSGSYAYLSSTKEYLGTAFSSGKI
jgi:hypothetical protein